MLLVSGIGFVLMYNEAYIPAPMPIIITSVLLTSTFYIMKYIKQDESKFANRIVTLSNTIFFVMIISVLAYKHWQWEQIVTDTQMMKIILILLSVFGLYLNIMYIRAESVYKEKRGNQRLKGEPEEAHKDSKKVAKSYKDKKEEIVTVIGNSLEHDNVPVILRQKDFFVHTLVVGSTGSGKTASVLEPIAYQLLVQKKLGKKLGLTVVEPKRDFALKVKEYCEVMDIPHIFIDPLSEDTHKFNPMEGNIDDVAEATVVVLKGLFGKQEAFFATVQELSARYVTKLLKELHGDNMDILDVMNTLRDPVELKRKVEQLKARDGITDLVHFFESELLGQHAEKYRQFVIGLRSQLENITSNDLLKRIMTGKSDVSIPKHFEEGGVLIVNTELGKLGTSGDVFGQFVIMHLQNGTFNRPGPEESRIPHFMIVDEYSRYINPEIERFLSIARSYRVAGIFATQSLGQLEIESGKISAKAMKQTILQSCRNKIVFGGVSNEDAKEFAEEFGKDKIIMRQSTYKHKVFIPVLFPESYRDTETEEYRYDPTDIMTEMKKYTFIHKLVYDNQVQRPSTAIGNLVPSDWKTLKEWQGNRFVETLKRVGAGAANSIKGAIHKTKDKKKQSRSNKENTEQDNNQIGEQPSQEQENVELVKAETLPNDSEATNVSPSKSKNGNGNIDVDATVNERHFKIDPKNKEAPNHVQANQNDNQIAPEPNTDEEENEYVPQASGDGFWD